MKLKLFLRVAPAVLLVSSCSNGGKAIDLSLYKKDIPTIIYDTALLNKHNIDTNGRYYKFIFKNEWNDTIITLVNDRYVSKDFYKSDYSTGVTNKSIIIEYNPIKDTSIIFAKPSSATFIELKIDSNYRICNLFWFQNTWRIVYSKGHGYSK